MKTSTTSGIVSEWSVSLLVTLIAAAVYAIIFGCLGFNPNAWKISFFGNSGASYSLPFEISRFWNLIGIYILTYLLAVTFSHLKENLADLKSLDQCKAGIFCGLLTGLFVGVTYMAKEDFVFIILFGIMTGVFFGLYLKDFKRHLEIVLSFGLGSFIAADLIGALSSSVIFGVAFYLIISLRNLSGFFKLNRTEIVCFPLRKNDDGQEQVLLGFKTQKVAKGRWNGYGGGVEKNEARHKTVVRELNEELGISVLYKNVDFRGYIFIKIRKFLWIYATTKLYIYTLRKWQGEFKESNEMVSPTWFNLDRLPAMIETDKLWLESILTGNRVEGTIWKNRRGQLISHTIEVIEEI